MWRQRKRERGGPPALLGPHTACGMVQAGACVAACHCRPRWQGVSARARVSMSVSVSVSVPVSVSVGSVSVYLRLSCVLVSAQVCKCKCVSVCVPVSGSRYVPACRPAWPCVCVHVSVSVSLSTYVHAWALCKMPTLPPSLSPPHPPSSFSLSLSRTRYLCKIECGGTKKKRLWSSGTQGVHVLCVSFLS
jgi:hypothetical protein